MTRRIRLSPLDLFLVLLTSLQLVELWAARPAEHTVAGVLLTTMSTATLLARHRAPLAATLLCLAAHSVLIQLHPDGMSTTFFALLVAMAVIGGLALRVAVVGLLGALGIAAQGAWLDVHGSGLADFAMSAAIMAAAWGLGMAVTRRGHAAQLAFERAETAERSRRQAAEEAVAQERSRVTRELHDVVAHGLTILVVQSVAAQDDLDHGAPVEALRSRLAATEEVARQSLAELRTLLGILHEVDTAPVLNTADGVAGLETLVDQLRAAGLDVLFEVHGKVHGLGPGLELALYRVAQESLTNVLKHAGHAATRLSVMFGDDEVTMTVENPLDTPGKQVLPGAGRGLAGLRERVLLHGGAFAAGPVEGRFRVRCRLPLRDAAPVLDQRIEVSR